MPAISKPKLSETDQVREELRQIRNQVPGVKGSLAASSDGLVVAHDLTDIEPTQVAALAAATLGLASRATLATGCGTFREAVSRGTDGYLAVYAAGDSTIVAVVGTSKLNLGMLQFRSREIIERIAACMARGGPRTSRTRPTDTGAATPGSASASASAASRRSAQSAPANRAGLPSRRAARS